MKYNIILNITTNCNYNCSYCNVVKDHKNISKENLDNIISFIDKNTEEIKSLKFFWWEPLLAFNEVKYLVDITYENIWNNYEIVTNTSLINDEIWDYFKKYFKNIYFSVDTENIFNYTKVSDFIEKYSLKEKLYFNVIFQPWKKQNTLKIFNRLYNLWFKNFNILPVYYTKVWQKEDLLNFSKIMKNILDLTKEDNRLKLVWFQENAWKKISLVNDSVFIDVDSKVYYSDIVSTFAWKDFKDKLFLWNIYDLKLSDIDYTKCKNKQEIISKIEEKTYTEIVWQKELHKIMDYFSEYLNH